MGFGFICLTTESHVLIICTSPFSPKISHFNCFLLPPFPQIFKSQKFPQTSLNRHMFHQKISPSNLITSTLLIELYNISNYLNSFCFVLFSVKLNKIWQQNFFRHLNPLCCFFLLKHA